MRAILIEANPEALVIAAENLIRSGVGDRATFVSAFAGDCDGSTEEFWTVGSGAAGSKYASHANTARQRGAKLTVPTVTVDAVCRRFGVPDMIKIDVEGAEMQVLSGASDCASHHGTRWIVEMHSNPDVPMLTNADRVLTWCRQVGLNAWYLKEHRLLEEAESIASRGRGHLLLQSAAWPFPEWLVRIEPNRQGCICAAYCRNRIRFGVSPSV